MAFGLNRIDLQKMATAKEQDAVLLFRHRRYSNSYYLAGYAVELGLKACVAKLIVAESIPDKQFILNTYVHDLSKLAGVAGLTRELRASEKADATFAS